MSIIFFESLYQPRVWGGRALADRLGRRLTGSEPFGEAWEIVDRPEAQSVDRKSGRTLRELLKTDPESIMGPGYDSNRSFPILVKWLDCSQRLSLQVHPPAAVAGQLGGEPKTECWYIAEAERDAALLVGLKRGAKRERFEQAIETETLEPLLHRFPVQAGQAMLLQSGRLHAIDAGNLILEIQQNSDTTYRVYDWGRRGLDGNPRQLHVEESLQSIDFDDIEPEPLPSMTAYGERTVAECPEFRIREFQLKAGESWTFEANQQPRILSVVTGNLIDETDNQALNASENALMPYSHRARFTATTDSTVLITDRFV